MEIHSVVAALIHADRRTDMKFFSPQYLFIYFSYSSRITICDELDIYSCKRHLKFHYFQY